MRNRRQLDGRGDELNRTDALNQIRRTLLLGARQGTPKANAGQFELALLGEPAGASTSPASPGDPDLQRMGSQLHDFLLELLLAIQMEVHGLVESPLQQRRRRIRLGSAPPLRCLHEWKPGSPAPVPGSTAEERSPVALETAQVSRGREAYYQTTLRSAHALADDLDLGYTLVEEMAARIFPLALQASAEDDLPGLVLGHGLRYSLTRTPRGRLAFTIDRERSRRSGVFLTPPELVRELLEAVLRPLEETDLHVLDPACGSGQFLIGAASRLLGSSEGLHEHPQRLRVLERVHGVDVDPRATRITAHNLTIWALERLRESIEGPGSGRRNGPSGEIHGVVLDRVFEAECPYVLGTQVQAGNALLSEPSSFSPGFQWSKRFSSVFGRDNPGFDVVIGNPPWISYGLRDRAAADEEERTYFERQFPQGTQYKLTLYPLFIELALRLTREGGSHGFLVPDSVLTGHHFSKIRKHLLASAHLYELSLIEAAPWPGAQVGYTVIYAARKKAPDLPAPDRVRNRVLAPIRAQRGRARNRGLPPGFLDALDASRTGRDTASSEGSDHGATPAASALPDATGSARSSSISLPGTGNGPALEGTEVWVPAARFKSGRGAALRIFRDSGEIDFLERVQAATLRVRDVAWTYSGLIARYGQKTVQSRRAESRFLLRDRRGRQVAFDEDAARRWCPALLSGSEVTPYRVRWGGGRVYLIDSREELARIFKSGFDLERYRRPKVFLRQTGDRLIAALDRESYFCMNNLHLIGGRADFRVPPLLLVGLLMSEPIQRTYRIYALEGSRPLAQVDLKTVESLPYPTDASGHPVGAGEPPPRTHPQSRKVLRYVDRALKGSNLEAVLKLVGRARDSAERTFEEGPLRGRDVLTLALTRIVEYQETWARAEKGTRNGEEGSIHYGDLQGVIDGVYGLLFRVGVEV